MSGTKIGTCSPVCTHIWKPMRDGAEGNQYGEWLQRQLYNNLEDEPIDLVDILHRAAATGHEECLRQLLDLGFCPNSTCESGMTPLIKAVKSGWHECVHALVDAGANVNERASDKMTALMYAVISGQDKCVTYLLNAGASVNMKRRFCSSLEMTAVSLAASTGHLNMFGIMLSHFGKHNWKNAVDCQWLLNLISNKDVIYTKSILELIIKEFGGVPWIVYEHIAMEDKHKLMSFLINQNLPMLECNGRRADVRRLLYSCVEAPEVGIACLKELLNSINELGVNLKHFLFDSTLLEYSCDMLNPDAVALFLQRGVKTESDCNETYDIPIKSCILGMIRNPTMGLKCLSVLIRHGWDVEKRFTVSCAFPPGNYQLTPLEYCLSGKNLFAAEMLILAIPTVYNPKSPHLKGSLRECIIPYPLRGNEKDLTTFVENLSSPFSLLHITRTYIRKIIGFNSHEKISQLPIPKSLKACLDLTEIDEVLLAFENVKSLYDHV